MKKDKKVKMTPKKFSEALLKWFKKHGRHDLPWQKPDPYAVWISEIMLQQTQVSTVIPYYEKFMRRFPTVSDLAQAEEDEVLKYWAGLGYYARGRNLLKTAQILIQKYQGIFPSTVEELASLPGIGRSTAGAVISLGMKMRAPILDGNVKRVLARYHGISEPINNTNTIKILWDFSEKYTPIDNVSDYNQAMMDLGATICTRRPECLKCIFKNSCQAYKKKLTDAIPTRSIKSNNKTKKSYFLIILNNKNEVLLKKRPPVGIWSGLHCLPEFKKLTDLTIWCELNLSLNANNVKKLPIINHKFSHFNLKINPVLCKIDTILSAVMESTSSWHPIKNIPVGLPAPIKLLLDKI